MDDDGEVLQQFKQQCLDYLDNVLEKIRGFSDSVYILNDEHLAALSVRMAQPLGIDESSVDFWPSFLRSSFHSRESAAED
jgi:hypothetical protein